MTEVQTPKSAKTMTIGCKLPNGHILQLEEPHEETEIGPAGQSRVVKVHRPVGEAIRLNGCAVPFGQQAKHLIIGGYGLTPGVPVEFWEKWLKAHKDDMIVKNNLIFAAPSRDAAEKQAEDFAEVKSGLEPLDPSFKTAKDGRIVPNDPRYPRSANANLTAPHTADRNAL